MRQVTLIIAGDSTESFYKVFCPGMVLCSKELEKKRQKQDRTIEINMGLKMYNTTPQSMVFRWDPVGKVVILSLHWFVSLAIHQ